MKILIIRDHGLGNMVNITPIIIKINELHPEGHIHLLCKKGYSVEPYSTWNLIEKFIFFENYDMLDVDYNYIFVAYSCRKDIKLNRYLQDRENVFYAKYATKEHEIDMNIKMLKNIGWNGTDIPHTYIPINDDLEKKLSSVYNKDDQCIGISAGWMGNKFNFKKNWGYERYANLIELYREAYTDHKIFIFGCDKDGNILNYIQDMTNIINTVDDFSLEETIMLINKCILMVGNDTGLLHIASALGVHNITIFGPTSIIKNRPRHDNIVISNKMTCSPCKTRGRVMIDCQHINCMNIEPEIIMNEIKNIYL